jgi:hypothetical protein
MIRINAPIRALARETPKRVRRRLFGGDSECVEWDEDIFVLATRTSLGMVAMDEHTESWRDLSTVSFFACFARDS